MFLRRVYVPLVFLFLEGLALHFYASSSVHTKARMLVVSDNIVGGVYDRIARAEHFVSLGTTNRALEERVRRLEGELAAWRERFSAAELDSIGATLTFPHEHVVARVVRNSIGRRENFIMIDRGTADGVRDGMAVTSIDGHMVGYVERASEHNAVCVSVLNTAFRASGLVSGTEHFGSVSWPGADPRVVRLTEVPKYAEIARGDTIVTSGYSFYFPEGIFIGTVEEFTTDETRASYDIDVRLGADIASLRVVTLVDNPGAFERIKLEREVLGTDAPGTATESVNAPSSGTQTAPRPETQSATGSQSTPPRPETQSATTR